jgi:hypothetical protein
MIFAMSPHVMAAFPSMATLAMLTSMAPVSKMKAMNGMKGV